jgi:hypothetical protein
MYPRGEEGATGKFSRDPKVQMQPWVLVSILLWAALHDRLVSWACQRARPRQTLPESASAARR